MSIKQEMVKGVFWGGVQKHTGVWPAYLPQQEGQSVYIDLLKGFTLRTQISCARGDSEHLAA